MLAVIVNWLYVITTTYMIGFGTLQAISAIGCMHASKGSKKFAYTYKYNESILIAGILVVNVYAELFSLISRVALAANLALIASCALIYIEYRESINERIIGGIRRISGSGSLWLYLAVFLLMAYGTSHGLMHYDTDLYHAQAIRWIEEYGTVKGLGNLHLRLGYNSASFALSALYSGSFWGKPMHAMGGYFALLLAWQCADLKSIVRRKYPVLSDFVRLMAIYYLFTIFDEIVSPASDYFMATMVFYIVIHWLDLYAAHERAFLPHALLSICAVYVTTIKLSAAPLVLLAIYPIVRIIKKHGKKGISSIAVCTLLCVIIALPYFVRNVYQTGWLVYPFTGIDLFGYAWKIPYERALSDANEITVYGRGFKDVSMIAAPFMEWFPRWVKNLAFFNKMMLLFDAICFPVFVSCVVYYIAVKAMGKSKKSIADGGAISKIFKLSQRREVSLSDFLFIEGIAYIALLYFIFTSPLVRYGCVYIWLPAVILIGKFAIFLDNRIGDDVKNYVYKVAIAAFAIFMLYKTGMLIKDDIPRFQPSYLLSQQAYNRYDLGKKEINGQIFYYPREGDRTGYDLFPSTPDVDSVIMAGDKLSDGFVPAHR